MAVMISIFVILAFLPLSLAINDPYTNFFQLKLPPGGPTGPESVALDPSGQGPYAGVSDGRIVKYKGPGGLHKLMNCSINCFEEFAYTSPNRTKACDGVTDINEGPTCGRPLGISFHSFLILFNNLYVVDTFHGLFKVGLGGGKAEFVTNSVAGVPFRFLNGIDVDQHIGDVYFTDGSQTQDIRNVIAGNFSADSTGMLMRYRPTTGEVKLLLKNLTSPLGPAVSHDGTFLLYSETRPKTIFKYWLTGPKSGTTEALLVLPETPLKIKRAPVAGEFWVAANNIVSQPPSVSPFGYKFDSNGNVLIRKDLGAQYRNIQVNVLQEYSNPHDNGVLYVGSREVDFVGVYSPSGVTGSL